MPETVVMCDNLVKIYKVADLEVVALQGLDLDVTEGEMIAIVGASGSGKSTLLNILSGLDVPSAGKCIVCQNDLTRLAPAQRLLYRRSVVGQLWQQSGRNLLPDLTILANVELPQLLNGVGSGKRQDRAYELLQLVGLGGMETKRPEQLSGGEQQRAGIAVALANEPRVLLADEPTGELDSVTAGNLLALLRRLNQQLNLTIITVTHDAAIAAAVDRTIAIRDGRTSTETIRRDAALETPATDSRGSAVIGLSAQTHRESVVIDRAGRLQLPEEALKSLAFHGRAEVRLVNDHVEIWPLPETNDEEAKQQASTSPYTATRKEEHRS